MPCGDEVKAVVQRLCASVYPVFPAVLPLCQALWIPQEREAAHCLDSGSAKAVYLGGGVEDTPFSRQTPSVWRRRFFSFNDGWSTMKQISWDEVMKRLEVASNLCNDTTPVQVEGPIHIGVDLGTADVVVMAVDDNGMPLSAFLEWATVVRDGVVVDYHGAITIVKRLIQKTEEKLGRKITEASTSFPPGTDARLSINILDAALLRVVTTADEPSCLARLAMLDRAAVVDIGGGTTGTAIISKGKVVDSIDDATGGHHVTLAMSGALSLPYEEAELKKRSKDNLQYAPIVKPVFERISDIVKAHISGHPVDTVYLTGGTCCFPGIAPLFQKELGIKVECPDFPLLLTPLAIACLPLMDA